MKVDKEILTIIQDHELVTQFIDQLCCSIENEKVEMPNFIPVCHDTILTDRLTKIVGYINQCKNGRLQ